MRGIFVILAIAVILPHLVLAELPSQIRLALAGADGMTVTWFTAQPTKTSSVRFGTDSSHLQTVQGFADTYGTGYFHKVKLSNLLPRTEYFYSCGDSTSGFSPIFSFMSAPSVGDEKPFSVAIVGDMGTYNGTETIAALRRAAKSTDWFLHVGDITYADVFPATFEQEWNSFGDMLQPVTAAKPYMVLPGNHEASCNHDSPKSCPSSLRNFTTYRFRFEMPWQESGGAQNMYYSFDYGPIHFIQISTETDFPGAPEGPGSKDSSGPFGDQLAWLQKDLELATANRKIVPWIVVSGHRPLYATAHSDPTVTSVFEKYFIQYDVDLYFSGHVHWYSRTWPVRNGVPTSQSYDNPSSTIYIVSGAGGCPTGFDTNPGNEPWGAFVENTFWGYGRLELQDIDTLRWRFIRSADDAVVDDIVIHKKH